MRTKTQIINELSEIKGLLETWANAPEGSDSLAERVGKVKGEVEQILEIVSEPQIERTDCTQCVFMPEDKMHQFCTSSEYGVDDGDGHPVDNHSIADCLNAIARAQTLLGICKFPATALADGDHAPVPSERVRRVEIANMMRVFKRVEDYLGELIRDNLVDDTPRASDLADDCWDARHGGMKPIDLGDATDAENTQRLIIEAFGSERLSVVVNHADNVNPVMFEVYGTGRGKKLYYQYLDAKAQFDKNVSEVRGNG